MPSLPTILGLDPGTRFLGAAVIRGEELLEFGVHEIRNGERPYDLIGQARSVVLRYIEQHEPTRVAIEAPYLITSKRGVLLGAIAQELHERARELGLEVWELSPEDVRLSLTGDPRATKIDVAEKLIRRGFRELEEKRPHRPVRSGLGLRSKDRYWLHAFDALSMAVAANTAA